MCDRFQMGPTGTGDARKDNPMPCYTPKIRGGCSTYMKQDGKVGTAGKGPLIQEEKSATLGVTQDQYLFVPDVCLNDQGGTDEREPRQDRNAESAVERPSADSVGE